MNPSIPGITWIPPIMAAGLLISPDVPDTKTGALTRIALMTPTTADIVATTMMMSAEVRESIDRNKMSVRTHFLVYLNSFIILNL